jgi:hypothetical protein
MMSGAPIKLTIYDQEDESVVKEFSAHIVPWGIMKRAIRLGKSMKGLAGNDDAAILEQMSEDDIDNLTGLVADVFGGRVTVEELERGATIPEMLAILQAVIGKAFGASQNPTVPGNKTRSRK